MRTAHRLRKKLLLRRAGGGGVGARHEAHARGGARGARERRLRASQAWREALRRGEREGESDEPQLHVVEVVEVLGDERRERGGHCYTLPGAVTDLA